jgi:hypothetical protein
VRSIEGKLFGHAWVQLNGERVHGSPMECEELLPVDPRGLFSRPMEGGAF